MRRMKKMCLLLGVFVFVVFAGCEAFMYPTISDVKLLNEANLEFQEDLQEATIDSMTKQHGAMSPENQEWFDAILAQNAQFVGELKGVAVSKASSASGPNLGAISSGGGVIDWLFNLLGLGWLLPFWNMVFGKSRSAGELAGLKDELGALKLKLATAAEAGADMPSDSK